MLSRSAFPIAGAHGVKLDLAAGTDPIATSERTITGDACDVEAADYVRKHHY
jgi:adenylosuccinate synthase